MICSASISNLLPALFKAQTEFPPVEKDATNPHFHSKYATLETVVQALQPTLYANGLRIFQPPASDPVSGYIGVGTWLFHESGEFMAETFLLPSTTTSGDKGTAQSATACVTYARKTAYLGILGVAPENEDDDGNTATGRSASPFQNDRKPTQTTSKASRPTETKTQTTKSATSVSVAPSTTTVAQPEVSATADLAQSAAPQPTGASADAAMPTEADLNSYRNNFTLLCNDLTTFKPVGLQPSPKLRVNTKVKVFLLKVNNVNRAKDLTKAQWLNFFDRVSKAKNDPAVGLAGLITLINRANGVEEKK